MSADLIARLIEAGTPAALVAEVAMLAARAEAEIAAAQAPKPGALRTRRWRERHAPSQHVTCDAGDASVTVGVTDTPSPAPSPSFPPNPQTNPAPTHTPATTTRARKGTRLPDDFAVPEDWLAWAMSERSWSRTDAESEGDSFCDHWRAKPGKDGVKLDWAATWRNWARNSRRNGNGQRSHHGSRAGGSHPGGRIGAASDFVFGGMDRG
ncbi:hypothetical protein [Sphingomonas nostoxanthinifaciens]|uniref:hypothetical protein n=1 Tax=Sphingomonas nostoxanthinifaciens TaxID=2872652 RepID=UPI001CC20BA1|nr:hypothetical protein [Sphingomonas nostoxanthinifaciens]UAK23653.1 hypothetical protein K8P63_14860 [Sphingomonas nostoxanthinifaciens]